MTEFAISMNHLPSLNWLLFCAICTLFGCGNQATNLQKVRYGSSPIYAEIPVHYALEKGLFTEEGISVDMSLFPDGKSALESLLDGEADIVSVMSTPVVLHAFREQGFKIIGAVDHGKFHTAIAKPEKIGTVPPADLGDVKIGVTKHTSGEYFMYSYLALHEIPWDSIDVTYGDGPALQKFFLEDSIDIMFSK